MRLCEFGFSAAPAPNDNLYWALSNAIVITYGRPFTDNEGLGPLGGKWERFSEDRLNELHKLTMDHRDEAVAHADLRHRTVRIHPQGSVMPNGLLGERMTITVERAGLGAGMYAAVRELCADLHPRLSEAINTELRQLYGDYAGPSFELLPLDAEASAS